MVLLASACGVDGRPTAGSARQIFQDVPAEIDPDARYLFYLHGAIIERAGVRPTHPRFGVYEYRLILEVFANEGFVVISEARPAGTDGTAYAATVADQVRALLAADVPPEVAGFQTGDPSPGPAARAPRVYRRSRGLVWGFVRAFDGFGRTQRDRDQRRVTEHFIDRGRSGSIRSLSGRRRRIDPWLQHRILRAKIPVD
jgi:hypothetical protein